jgi:cytochrome c
LTPRLLAAGALLAALAAPGAQSQQLTPGPGVGLVTAKCVPCHDAGHIARSKLSRNEWTDNLASMISRGMPAISEAETRVIIDYLSMYYGSASAAQPAPDTLALAAGAGDPVRQMLDANACNACHSVDQKVIGPAFRDIAKRYAGDSGAAARLAAKIRAGGVGVWGDVPMPANSALLEREIAQLVEWVLGGN